MQDAKQKAAFAATLSSKVDVQSRELAALEKEHRESQASAYQLSRDLEDTREKHKVLPDPVLCPVCTGPALMVRLEFCSDHSVEVSPTVTLAFYHVGNTAFAQFTAPPWVHCQAPSDSTCKSHCNMLATHANVSTSTAIIPHHKASHYSMTVS